MTRNTTDSPWTEGNIQFLRMWWMVEGLSAAQIARKFGEAPLRVKVTRCAVIGKLKRLGLTRFEQGKNCSSGQHNINAGRKRAPHSTKPNQKAHPNTTPKPYRERGAERNEAVNVPFIARVGSQCPMFCEGEEGALGLVCGRPATHGTWCERCATLVYTGRTAGEMAA